MKKTDRLICRVAAGAFLVGLLFRSVGSVMGGRSESREYGQEILNARGWGPVQVIGDGVMIGGERGIRIDSSGVHFGGEKGIYQSERTDKEQMRESGTLNGISCVDIDIDCGDIWVQTGENCSVVLSWNLFGYAMDYRVENGVLKVESEGTGENFTGDLEFTSRVIVTVPAGTELQKLDLSTDFGDISVDTEEVTAWETAMNTDLGDVNSFGLTARTLKAESSLGDVTVHFPQQGGVGYQLSSSLGKVTVNESSFQGECETTYTDKEQKYFIEAQTDLGDVTLLF